jgi:branched-chain amino acid transport system permease protein
MRIEMLYHLQLNQALGPTLRFLGATIDASRPDAWFGAAFAVATGAGLFELARRQFAEQWGGVQEEIEKEIKHREAL